MNQGTPLHNPAPTLSFTYLREAHPSMAWRVDYGDLHACGESPEQAVGVLERALAGAS